MNGLAMIGLSHHTAALRVRERLALDDAQATQLLTQLRTLDEAFEAVVLSTCNRTEIYIASGRGASVPIQAVQSVIAKVCDMSLPEVEDVTEVSRGAATIRHLLRVTCGLDAMVLGETQVLGQAKKAYRHAATNGSAGAVMHSLFQAAFRCAKELHTTTGIGQGNLSVASAAIRFARQIFATFEDKTVVGLGAGEMAQLTLRHLQGLNPKRIWLVNRSESHAMALARNLDLHPPQGGVRPIEDLDELILAADVMVCATGARHPILDAERMRPLARQRRHRPLFILDIAVPRDVAAEVRDLPDCYLYDLDDLQAHLAGVKQNRQDRLDLCERLVGEHAETVAHHLQHADIGRMIRRLRRKLQAMADVEQQRTVRKLAAATDADVGRILDQHTHRLINKILHLPLQKLKQPDAGPGTRHYAQAIESLFALNGEEDPEETGQDDVR